MPKARTQAAVIGGSADEVEAAFYEAMQNADIERLMACWSDDDEIVCVHPGGPRVVGAAAIRATFDAIFSNGSIRAWPEQVRRIEALASVVHNVLERVEVLTDNGPARPMCWQPTSTTRPPRAGAWWPTTPAPAARAKPTRSTTRRRCCIDRGPAGPVTMPALSYRAPGWLPGGHLQTIWPALASRRVFGPPLHFRRERWTTPDQDFLDVDWLVPGTPGADLAAVDAAPASAGMRPLLVLFHGLEGSSGSHYAQAFADVARESGAAFAVAHFRGCSGELNRAPRAYHSGDHAEIDWVLRRFRAHHHGPLVAVGVSLGGNALMRWAGEMGAAAQAVVGAVAAVCSPLDLAAGGHAIGRGFNRLVYTPMFLRTMKPKALRKWQQHPGLFDREALLQARDLHAFDNVFTAPPARVCRYRRLLGPGIGQAPPAGCGRAHPPAQPAQ